MQLHLMYFCYSFKNTGIPILPKQQEVLYSNRNISVNIRQLLRNSQSMNTLSIKQVAISFLVNSGIGTKQLTYFIAVIFIFKEMALSKTQLFLQTLRKSANVASIFGINGPSKNCKYDMCFCHLVYCC